MLPTTAPLNTQFIKIETSGSETFTTNCTINNSNNVKIIVTVTTANGNKDYVLNFTNANADEKGFQYLWVDMPNATNQSANVASTSSSAINLIGTGASGSITHYLGTTSDNVDQYHQVNNMTNEELAQKAKYAPIVYGSKVSLIGDTANGTITITSFDGNTVAAPSEKIYCIKIKKISLSNNTDISYMELKQVPDPAIIAIPFNGVVIQDASTGTPTQTIYLPEYWMNKLENNQLSTNDFNFDFGTHNSSAIFNKISNNKFSITVTAEDGTTTQTYIFKCALGAPDLNIEGIKFTHNYSGAPQMPPYIIHGFNINNPVYDIQISNQLPINFINYLNFTILPEDEEHIVDIDNKTSGVVHLTVKPQDSSKKQNIDVYYIQAANQGTLEKVLIKDTNFNDFDKNNKDYTITVLPHIYTQLEAHNANIIYPMPTVYGDQTFNPQIAFPATGQFTVKSKPNSNDLYTFNYTQASNDTKLNSLKYKVPPATTYAHVIDITKSGSAETGTNAPTEAITLPQSVIDVLKGTDVNAIQDLFEIKPFDSNATGVAVPSTNSEHLTIRVTAQDGTTRDYVFKIRSQSAASSLDYNSNGFPLNDAKTVIAKYNANPPTELIISGHGKINRDEWIQMVQTVDSQNQTGNGNFGMWESSTEQFDIRFQKDSIGKINLPNDSSELFKQFDKDIYFGNNIDTSNVTKMNSMFSGAKAFNQPLDNFNTDNVTNMVAMFGGAKAFNQPLDNFNTDNVTNMGSMFDGAEAFNQPLDNFNTDNVTIMSFMFDGAKAFNQPLDNFNTDNVTKMSAMFRGAEAFNQPLDNFNTDNVHDMSFMFKGAKAFNQPLDNFNTNNVTSMLGMFRGAEAFNQPLDNFNTDNVTNMAGMFLDAGSFEQDIDFTFPNDTTSSTKNVILGGAFKNSKIKNIKLTLGDKVTGHATSYNENMLSGLSTLESLEFNNLTNVDLTSHPRDYTVENITTGITEQRSSTENYTFIDKNHYKVLMPNNSTTPITNVTIATLVIENIPGVNLNFNMQTHNYNVTFPQTTTATLDDPDVPESEKVALLGINATGTKAKLSTSPFSSIMASAKANIRFSRLRANSVNVSGDIEYYFSANHPTTRNQQFIRITVPGTADPYTIHYGQGHINPDPHNNNTNSGSGSGRKKKSNSGSGGSSGSSGGSSTKRANPINKPTNPTKNGNSMTPATKQNPQDFSNANVNVTQAMKSARVVAVKKSQDSTLKQAQKKQEAQNTQEFIKKLELNKNEAIQNKLRLLQTQAEPKTNQAPLADEQLKITANAQINEEVENVVKNQLRKTGTITPTVSVLQPKNSGTIIIKPDDKMLDEEIDLSAKQTDKIRQEAEAFYGDDNIRKFANDITLDLSANVDMPNAEQIESSQNTAPTVDQLIPQQQSYSVPIEQESVNNMISNDVDNFGVKLDIASLSVAPVDLRPAPSQSSDEPTSMNMTFIPQPNNVPASAFRTGYSVEVNISSGDKERHTLSEPAILTFYLDNFDFGEDVSDQNLSIHRLNEKTGVWEPVGGKYDPVTNSISTRRISLSQYTVMKSNKSFSDIDDSWAEDEINALLNKGVVNEDKDFKPQEAITRKEFTAWLVKTYGLDKDGSHMNFVDVAKDDKYYKQLASGYEAGLFSGKADNTFDPDAPITRQEMAALVSNALVKYDDKKLNANLQAKLNAFGDVDEADEWSKNALAFAVELDLMPNDNGLDPNGVVTKEMAAALLKKIS